MRFLRPWLLMSLALLLPMHAHASLLAKFFFFLRTTTAASPAPKPKLVGQETRSFKLQKAHAEDLLIPIQHYLDGISKMGGAVQIRTADNALVATDYPENLLRLSALIPDIDQVYSNANAQARQMLVTQSLMKAIRNHPDSTVTTRSAGDHTASLRINNGPDSLAPSTRRSHAHDEDDMGPVPARRAMDSPRLSQFEVVGWMQDDQGYMVVLNNGGERFLFRHGKLRGGYNPKATPVQGISGAIHDQELTLNDGQTHISLKMLKWRSL
jgi:hypothetical protein